MDGDREIGVRVGELSREQCIAHAFVRHAEAVAAGEAAGAPLLAEAFDMLRFVLWRDEGGTSPWRGMGEEREPFPWPGAAGDGGSGAGGGGDEYDRRTAIINYVAGRASRGDACAYPDIYNSVRRNAAFKGSGRRMRTAIRRTFQALWDTGVLVADKDTGSIVVAQGRGG